jgi:hypothetical protein
MNMLFWVLVLGIKCTFDWFAVMKTVERSVIVLWGKDWLDWGIPVLGDIGDAILVVGRMLPAFLVVMNDTQASGDSEGFVRMPCAGVGLQTYIHHSSCIWNT